MKRKLLALGILVSFQLVAYTQTNLPLTADSLATGNYKDVLNSFFQLAFNKLITNDREIKFTSNPFAVMAKANPSLLVDTMYYRYRHLRNLNFAFSAKLDSSFKFNGFSSGVKYALINKRDETVSRLFLNMVANDPKISEYFTLSTAIAQYIASLVDNRELQTKVQNDETAFRRGEKKFSELDPAFRQKLKELAKQNNLRYLVNLMEGDPDFNIKKLTDETFDSYKDYFNNRLLWTIEFSDTTYKDQFLFSNLVFTSEMVKAIDSLKNNDIELNLKSDFQFIDDTTKAGRDLSRKVFNFEPGINFVVKTKNTRKSFLELKVSGNYYHIFSGVYKDERNDNLTLNGTLRVRIINDIWVPLEIKYDPKSGNVFGFLNVRINFEALRRLINPSK
jgi:hypothetical protein